MRKVRTWAVALSAFALMTAGIKVAVGPAYAIVPCADDGTGW